MGAVSLQACEARRSKRLACRVPVKLWSPLVSCDRLVTRDISENGVGLDLGNLRSDVFARAARWCRNFVVEFGLPTGRVCSLARVAWLEQVRSDRGFAWRAGLEFVQLNSGSRTAIREYLTVDSVRRLMREIEVS